jgi:hypothetical protein
MMTDTWLLFSIRRHFPQELEDLHHPVALAIHDSSYDCWPAYLPFLQDSDGGGKTGRCHQDVADISIGLGKGSSRGGKRSGANNISTGNHSAAGHANSVGRHHDAEEMRLEGHQQGSSLLLYPIEKQGEIY